MPTPRQTCPDCKSSCLRCRRSTPDYGSALHDLEMSRQSVWECAVCGARYLLDTPPGKLKKLKRK